MADERVSELELSTAARRRGPMIALALAAVGLVLAGGLVLANADPEPTRVASRGRKASPPTTAGEDLSLELSVPGPITSTTLKVKVPRVTVPTVPKVPVTVPRAPVVCPTYPAAQTPSETGVYAAPTGGGPLTRLMGWSSEFAPQDIDLSPDGRQLLLNRLTGGDQAHPYTLHLANADGSGEQAILADRYGPHHAHWSPDGRLIAFRDWVPGTGNQVIGTYVVDPATWAVTQVGSNSQGIGFYEWSPDSRRLAWGDHAAPGVFVGSVDGAPVQRLGVAGGTVWDLDWSPDGSEIVATTTGGGATLYSVDGARSKVLHPTAIRVAWSRVNRTDLVLDANALMVVDPDTGLIRPIGDRGVHGILRDGSRMVTTDSTGIHLVDFDGCRRTIVSGSGSNNALRDWADDGRSLIVIRFQ